ncbi:MAG: STAS domain-containing protein [Myxococcota bacterium]
MEVEKVKDGLVVRLPHSRLDAARATEFRTGLAAAVDGHCLVVLDMSKVQYVDSAGLGAIVGVLKVMPKGCELRLAHCTTPVRKIIELTRLDRVFPPFATVEAALAEPLPAA